MRGFGTFLLVFGLCVGAFALAAPFLWRELKGFEAPIRGELERVGDDAAAFAADHEQADCEPEARRRLAACDGLWCEIQTPIFTKQCLRQARASRALCEDMPASPLEAALWPARRCSDFPADAQICQRIELEVLKACSERLARR